MNSTNGRDLSTMLSALRAEKSEPDMRSKLKIVKSEPQEELKELTKIKNETPVLSPDERMKAASEAIGQVLEHYRCSLAVDLSYVAGQMAPSINFKIVARAD